MTLPERVYASTLSLLVTLAVLSPLLRDPPRDSFPLSNYPMFSSGRADPTLVLTQALGVQSDGRSFPLPPIISTGSHEVLQSMQTLHREVRRGRSRRDTFCREVAQRVAAADDPSLRDTHHVELVHSRFDALAYFETGTEPLQRRRLARCEVPR